MLARKKIINGSNASCFVSVHINYYSSPSRRGAQAFLQRERRRMRAVCGHNAKNLNTLGGQTRSLAPLTGDYYVLNEAEPTATLVECGFLSNEEDENFCLPTNTERKSLKRSATALWNIYSSAQVRNLDKNTLLFAKERLKCGYV